MISEYDAVKKILDSNQITDIDDIEYGSQCFDELFDYYADEMPYGVQKARTGMPDEWIADRLIDLGLLKEAFIKEDAPFGSGMELLRMAIMRKFITVQEWDLLKHKWKEAAAEVEEKYADWPEGEGFGSSDHNFAIRDLMTAVGYEFDDKDTSGSFVVTKQPEEIEKAGIKNARMKGQPVAQESEPSADAERADAARGMWASSKEIQSKFKTWQDFMNSEDFDEWLDDKFREDAGEKIANMAQSMSKDEFMSHADELGLTPEEAAEHYEKMSGGAHAGKFEDEGEKFTFGQIAKAKAYAKTYANDMTSAVKNIEAIATGLSKHPEVADTLKKANENQELNRITKLAGLGEGADFYGYYKDPKDPSGKTMTYPDDMEFKTPHRSNANARMVLSRIGLDPDFENTGSTPIDDFIAATDKYLRMNVSDKDNPHYDEVEMYDMEAKRIKKQHPEVTHVGFN